MPIQPEDAPADTEGMAEYAWRPLGELLVARGLIDQYDLEVALKEQRLTGQLLGELLVAKRLISPMQLAAALAAHHGVHLDGSVEPPDSHEHVCGDGARTWRPLGRILVDRGMLTESGLQRALLAQRRLDQPLGEILLQRKWVTPADLADALAEQHGLTLHSSVLETAQELDPSDRAPERFELRRSEGEAPIFISQSFLDATDFTFELLHSTDPDRLEIIRVAGSDEERVWHYTREESDAFRAEVAESRKRYLPLELVVDQGDPHD